MQGRRFQLTRPVWGEPPSPGTRGWTYAISTHSPRVGRTHSNPALYTRFFHFNSLAPCGANPVLGEDFVECCEISTHSPRVGRTLTANVLTSEGGNFNSLAPCGANPSPCRCMGSCRQISTHSPRVGRTTARHVPIFNQFISTHSPRVGRTFCPRKLLYSK